MQQAMFHEVTYMEKRVDSLFGKTYDSIYEVNVNDHVAVLFDREYWRGIVKSINLETGMVVIGRWYETDTSCDAQHIQNGCLVKLLFD